MSASVLSPTGSCVVIDRGRSFRLYFFVDILLITVLYSIMKGWLFRLFQELPHALLQQEVPPLSQEHPPAGLPGYWRSIAFHAVGSKGEERTIKSLPINRFMRRIGMLNRVQYEVNSIIHFMAQSLIDLFPEKEGTRVIVELETSFFRRIFNHLPLRREAVERSDKRGSFS